MHSRNPTPPLAYFLTWSPYGTWLPGDERCWRRRGDGEAYRQPSPALLTQSVAQTRAGAVFLSPAQQAIVVDALERCCRARGRPVHALAVASAHVHLVLSAAEAPEAVLAQVKSWSTRALRERGGMGARQTVWARHGSTRYLYDEDSLERAVYYVSAHR